MQDGAIGRAARRRRATGRALAALTVALMLSACSESTPSLDLALNKGSDADKPPLSELDKAAKKYAENPTDVDGALAYADMLKQNGRKPEALTVLQNTSQAKSGDRRLMSAYGRLALDQGKLSLAKGLLEAADDPTNPDWKVVCARGTVLAKEGKHAESIAFFERARPLSKDHPSVINNLALAYMMSGEPAKAEPLLRQASAADPTNVKVRQNLALVLGLQGRFDEAKALAAHDLSPDAAAANTELMRKIVRLEQKPSAKEKAAAVAESNWDTTGEDPKPRPAAVPAARKQIAKPAPPAANGGLRGSSVETSSTQ